MKTPPIVVEKVTIVEKLEDKINISWAKVGPTSSISYEIFVKGDSDKTFEKSGETK
jgi:hypothetical protein